MIKFLKQLFYRPTYIVKFSNDSFGIRRGNSYYSGRYWWRANDAVRQFCTYDSLEEAREAAADLKGLSPVIIVEKIS